MSKTDKNNKKKDKSQAPLPEILKQQSKFSGGHRGFGVPGQKAPANNFTPQPVRFTQHKGGN